MAWRGRQERQVLLEGWWGRVGRCGSVGCGKWVENVIEVKKLSERIMLIRVSIGVNILNVISGYAPQAGREIVEKEEFWLALSKIVDEIEQEEFVMIGGDMNGHVGAKADGYEGVHGGKGYGERNTEGEMLLEFADAMKLVVLNTLFTKKEPKKVTYESGENKTVV